MGDAVVDADSASLPARGRVDDHDDVSSPASTNSSGSTWMSSNASEPCREVSSESVVAVQSLGLWKIGATGVDLDLDSAIDELAGRLPCLAAATAS